MFEYAKNNASKYLDMEDEDLVVSSLLNKYNVSVPTNKSFLFDLNDEYIAFAKYISELYIENKDIPVDIKTELENNIHFKNYLISDIQKRMNKILYDNDTIIFKEIVTTVNLLSFGSNYDIFENYNTYNFNNLSELFRDYEKKLIEEKEENRNKCFKVTFSHYIMLIEILSELCKINSTDILRKKLIKPTIELITESINILKFKIALEEEKINILNNILGKFLFYFSHIPYINVVNKDVKYLVDEFTFNCEKICDGYVLSKNTNFAGDSDKSMHYKDFLNSFSTLVCNLIYKVEENYDVSQYSDIYLYKSILELYDEMCEHKELKKFETIDELKASLLDNYAYIYQKKDTPLESYLSIVDDFLTNQNFNSSNMQILCSIVLYSTQIHEDKYLQILKTLLKINKYENDYHEFFKLTLCDILISKLTQLNNHAIKDYLHEQIVEYIEVNQIASHLMSIYSKIYLSLSMYYSHYFDLHSNELAKQFYYKYLCINGKNLLENEYKLVNKQILLNLGKRSIDEMKLENVQIKDEKYIEIGSRIIEQYAQDFDINVKYNINQKLSNIVTDIFTNDGLDNELLNKHIEGFISQDIFHGLVFSAVEGLCEVDCRVNDLGYKKLEIQLLENYKLRMAYSSVYEDIFNNIYEQNKDYIKQNVINLIISYLKSIPIYIDSVTKLRNTVKLEKEFHKIDCNKEMIFIEVYFENLSSFNNKYGYEQGNEIFKSFASKMNIIESTYRLQGPRLGMIVKEHEDYKECVDKIKRIKVEFDKYIISPELTIAVAWGSKDNILTKSEYAMSLALNKKSKYNEFK